MAQPPPYTPGTDFSVEEANAVGGRSTVRTAQLDAELAALEVTLDALCTNLALIQRDDGEVRDGKVKLHTLAADVKRLLTTYDCVVRGAWLTATEYALKDVVTQGGVTYLCAVKHTSGVFATDLAATKWLALSSTLATDVAFTPANGIAASNVQAALEEIGAQIGDGSSCFGFRNRIVNGDMRIDQRNNGSAVNITSGPTFCVDRWTGSVVPATGVISVQRLATGTPPAGFTHYMRTTVTTADASLAATDVYALQTYIEGYEVADFGFGSAGAATLTLSFRVRSSIAGTFSGSFLNNTGLRSYPFTFVINQANTWETKSVTFVADTAGTWLTDNTNALSLRIDLGCGSTYRGTAGAWVGANIVGVTGAVSLINTLNATFDLTGVQLEAGAVATAFERLPYTEALQRCKRYYQWMSVVCHTAMQYSTYYAPVPMRVNPTIGAVTVNAGAGATFIVGSHLTTAGALVVAGSGPGPFVYANTNHNTLATATFPLQAD